MIQCSDCEFYNKAADGRVSLRCDPLTNIKEPECLMKWQLLRMGELCQRVDRMVTAYESTLEIYRRFAPMQEKMFRHMEREIDDAEDADSWKQGDDDDEDDDVKY